uniref:Diguanylate cyclase n=1 Tax=candidate division WOR-3 bacterium TaxID=2052148 RepID=A0A7C4THW6_UNCW3
MGRKNKDIIEKYYKKAENLESIVATQSLSDKIILENRYLRQLLELTSTINRVQDFGTLLEKIIDGAISITKAERGFILLFDKNGYPEIKIARNIKKENIESPSFYLSRSVINQVAETMKPIFLTDVEKDENFKTRESIIKYGLRMIMCAPLFVKDNFFGLIYVDACSPIESFTKLERQLFETFAAQASIAIENRHLFDLSIRDFLTGLFNYSYLYLRLQEETEMINRYSEKLRGNFSLMMIDIDGFKSVNDTYGHTIGNRVLREIANCIKEEVRKVDIVARYGGDEFIILMPNTDEEGAYLIAKRVSQKVRDHPFSVGEKTIHLTLSIGISSIAKTVLKEPSTIIMEADSALYQSKKKGGDSISIFLKSGAKEEELELVAKSQIMERILNSVKNIAQTDVNLLITGETGTGKELISRYIHKLSPRSEKPFLVINCAAVPATLLESELFGYTKGAFTGAYKEKRGMFELANGGTVLLDEISEIPLHLQAKILRVVETKEIEKLGREKNIKTDVRIIATTNRNIEEEVKRGRFRKDLFYRLNVARIHLPPLRERTEDIIAIAEFYLKIFNKKYLKQIKEFDELLKQKMQNYGWPGNVRELISRIERAVIMSSNDYLTIDDFEFGEEISKENGFKDIVEEAKLRTIQEALAKNKGNITKTARALGISRNTIKNILKKNIFQ